MLPFVLGHIVAQVRVPAMFSFCWHTDTYRTVASGHGAFELCLPSLGFLFTKLVLRTQLLGQRCRMMSGGQQGQIATLSYGSRGMWVCNTMPFRVWLHGSVLRTSAAGLHCVHAVAILAN